jgi:hypothetical protein
MGDILVDRLLVLSSVVKTCPPLTFLNDSLDLGDHGGPRPIAKTGPIDRLFMDS